MTRNMSKEELLAIFFSGFPAFIAAFVVIKTLRAVGVEEPIIKWASIATGAVVAPISAIYILKKFKNVS